MIRISVLICAPEFRLMPTQVTLKSIYIFMDTDDFIQLFFFLLPKTCEYTLMVKI